MWRSAWFMRAARAKNAGTSDVYIGRRRRERVADNRCGNERKRKGRESAYARRNRRGRTFACLRRFRAVSGNKRQTRTAEKVSVARFARVHLTKKSNIYFPARTTKRFWNFFLRLRPLPVGARRGLTGNERQKIPSADEAPCDRHHFYAGANPKTCETRRKLTKSSAYVN